MSKDNRFLNESFCVVWDIVTKSHLTQVNGPFVQGYILWPIDYFFWIHNTCLNRWTNKDSFPFFSFSKKSGQNISWFRMFTFFCIIHTLIYGIRLRTLYFSLDPHIPYLPYNRISWTQYLFEQDPNKFCVSCSVFEFLILMDSIIGILSIRCSGSGVNWAFGDRMFYNSGVLI